ncbi:MAG TPA: hypothetical protein VMS65_04130 [Polyangiaceae bacterium]|nr:hypothetical protein [Polyangiaceae bacterium]
MPSFALFVLVSCALAGCAPLEPEVLTLEIRAHSIDGSERCKIVGNPLLELHALGPFPETNLGAEVLPYRTAERTLAFPDETRGVEAEASDGERTWLGVTERASASAMDVLLWERGIGCELFQASTAAYPASNGGQAIGYSPEAGIVLLAGGDELGGAAASSLELESDTGTTDVPSPSFPQARAFATVTPFGSGLLLAGGENPLNTDVEGEREARQNAPVYDPLNHGFDDNPIALELARTRHAAVVLESGETLLVGGGRPSGDGTTVIVEPFEVVSPETRRSRIDGLVGLADGRLEPTALRLDNGNVLVGGGYTPTREPVATVEWFSPDGSSQVSPGAVRCGFPFEPCAVLTPRHHRAFVALPGGGALTVGGCAPGEQDGNCETACGVGFGCPAPEADATWIAPDGELTPIKLEQPLDCPAPFSPERVLLAPGSDGAPWLLAFDESVEPPCRAVFRFKPWENEPVFGVASLRIELWPVPEQPLVSLGPDAFVWLSEDDPPFLVGVRAGVRGALSQNETLLGSDPSAPAVPLHLAPDRPPDRDPEPDEPGVPDPPKAIYRLGRLLLDPERDGHPPVTVLITDARYDDVTITFGYSGETPPLLVLGPHAVGDADCAWPGMAVSPIVVERSGSEIVLSDAEGMTATCGSVPSGPLSVGFRAGRTRTTLASLNIVRR